MTTTLNLTIDEKPVTVPVGTTIWEAAQSADINVPVLCHHPKMSPVGVCRVCVVDVGEKRFAPACMRECQDGMQIHTQTEPVVQARRNLLAMLLADHPTPCEREKTTANCELEALAREYDLFNSESVSFYKSDHAPAKAQDDSSPVIAVDHQACILCDRCIRACDEIQSNNVIGKVNRAQSVTIGFDFDQPMGKSTCVACGECAASCPTGALTHKAITLPLAPTSETENVDSVCPWCGVGCAITYHVRDNQIIQAEGRDGSGNEGRLCVKGRYGWDYAMHKHRLTTPLIRRDDAYPKGAISSEVKGEGKNKRGKLVDYEGILSSFREATWEEALDLTANRLNELKEKHGSSALAGFGSAKCSNEEAYLFQKLIRAGLGTNNVDHCTRLCHASSVAALLEGIGSGAVTDVYANARLSDVILLTGTNTTANHPVAATFFKEAIRNGTRLIVVDPRRPEMASFAEHYCQIRSGTDVAFYNALAHVLIEENLINQKFIADRTEGFDDLHKMLQDYAPERMAGICGIDAETLREVARLIGSAERMLIFWGMGISQHTHGTDNARCLIMLSLLTGNVGRAGTGLHPLRGQNNVQGASDAGLIPMYYPDYQHVENEQAREKFESAWNAKLDPKMGLTVVEIISGALEGNIRGMYVMGENPFLSDPNINKVRKALANLEFLAVQDIFLTETAEFADVILPASSFLEKTGTYTNTDRRVQIGRAAITSPGQARVDWEVICDLSRRLGYAMSYDSPEEIFTEFCALTKNYATLNYDNLGPGGKLWPCPNPETELGQEVMFDESFPTPSGKGRFVPCSFAPAKELPDDEYPFVLNTGRLLEHWHTGTMTRRASVLDTIQPGPFVEMHPDDLTQLGVAEGEQVQVQSRRGEILLPVKESRNVAPGSVFIPFHFREAAANVLTIDDLDPDGKIPEFKFCAVRIAKASGVC